MNLTADRGHYIPTDTAFLWTRGKFRRVDIKPISLYQKTKWTETQYAAIWIYTVVVRKFQNIAA